MTDSEGMRLDDLARRAGVATTTVRLYQNKGLLAGPRLVGRIGYYDEHHLTRLRLISRLQEQGFSLAGIARVIETWEQGGDLDALIGVEHELDELLSRRHEVVYDADELLSQFPADMVTPEVVQRAAAVGLIELTDDGRFRVPDRRFIETGSALAHLGVPADIVIDEWSHLVDLTDGLAERFIALFEAHLLPEGWEDDPARAAATPELAASLAELRGIARSVVLAALDDSLARKGAQRLGELTGDDDTTGPAPSGRGG